MSQTKKATNVSPLTPGQSDFLNDWALPKGALV